jgi:hypothetical protein
VKFIKDSVRAIFRLTRRDHTDAMFWVGRDDEGPNFGDLIGPYLYKKITGKDPVFKRASNRAIRNTVYSTVGSIMYWCRDNSIIWGSGIVRKDENFPKPHSVHSVRGPLTRNRFLELGYPCPEVYGDPGLLMPLHYSPKTTTKEFKLGIIPHYVDQKRCHELFKAEESIKIINVFDPIESVIDQISQCECIASSSLHGIIMSISYQVPAVWVKFGDDLWGDDVKFQDFYLSIGCKAKVEPTFIASSTNITELIVKANSAFTPEINHLEKIQKQLIETCPFSK